MGSNSSGRAEVMFGDEIADKIMAEWEQLRQLYPEGVRAIIQVATRKPIRAAIETQRLEILHLESALRASRAVISNLHAAIDRRGFTSPMVAPGHTGHGCRPAM